MARIVISHRSHILYVTIHVCVVSMVASIYSAVQNMQMLQRSTFFSYCSSEWIFPTVRDAVLHASNGRWLVRYTYMCAAGAIIYCILATTFSKSQWRARHDQNGEGTWSV